jgi:transposase
MKKDEQSITISKDSVKIEEGKIYVYKKSFSDDPLILRNKKDKKYEKLIKEGLRHDIKITKNKIGKYYIHLPYDVKIEKNEINKNNIVSCDPGERTFLTTYNENEIMEIGTDVSEKVGKIHKKIDMLQKERKKNYCDGKLKEANELTKEIRKKYIKIKNSINDLHYKTITKLMKYDVILSPILRISSKKRKVSKQTVRMLNALSSSKFNKRLLNKAEPYNKLVVNCDEKFTTQNCGNCFKLNNIGSNKEYNCRRCNLRIDRDHNASRNILIRQLKSIL